jgi:hypothetical protein
VSQEKALPVRRVKRTYILSYRITPTKKQGTLFAALSRLGLFPRAHSVLPFCITFPVSSTLHHHYSSLIHQTLTFFLSSVPLLLLFKYFSSSGILWFLEKSGLFLRTLADSVLLRPENVGHFIPIIGFGCRCRPINQPSHLT